jgi:hypothetical protein
VSAEDKFISGTKAAEMLGVERSTVRKWTTTNCLPDGSTLRIAFTLACGPGRPENHYNLDEFIAFAEKKGYKVNVR